MEFLHSTASFSVRSVDEEHNKVVALIVRMMFLLKQKFPFPSDLHPKDVNENMFDSANMRLMSIILHYILSIINPEKCSLVVPHPLTAKSTAHFQKGVMKFLMQTFNELPHMKIDGLRNSTLTSCSGSRFIEFLARLITNTVQLVYEKYGVISVPNCVGLDANDKQNLMEAKRDRALHDLLQLRHPSAKRISDVPRHEEALQKLKVVLERLEARYKLVVSSCPPPYRESLGSCNRERTLEVLETWKNDLKKSLDESSSDQDLSNAIGDSESIETPKEPTRLDGDTLLNPKNEQIISKIAEDQKIQLFDGHSVSLPGFLQCSSAIVEKLNTIIVNSKFRESIQWELAIETFLERLSELVGDIVTLEEEIQRLKSEGLEHQKKYDELVEKGKITHRFSYSCSFLDPDLKIPSKPESQLTLSPGNSWKEELEDVKRKCYGIERDSPVHITPKLSRKRIDNSIGNLSRTVLEKRAWASGSRGADSTVGEMFQGPLSSSSPVNSAGDHVVASTRKSISDMIGDISLDAELNDFLADVSEMEDSGSFSPDDTFGESQQSLEASTMPEIPSVRVQETSPVATPANPTISHRRARPSLDVIVKRYAALRAKIND
uniref:HAUS augmin-like complex subunit 6 n=1 Tax=Lygus hesperus TaxID=30085 RepID=A0A0A9YIK4_LYGHE